MAGEYGGSSFKTNGTPARNVEALVDETTGRQIINSNDVMPFNQAVALGIIPGYSSVSKFGTNPIITTATDPEDIWEFGGSYPYDADGTAPIQYTSSSNALDTGQSINVQGLDINGVFVSQDIITNGLTIVNLTTPLWRVFRLSNNAVVGKDITGTFYCHTSATVTAGVPPNANVMAIITAGNNQTLMAVYTIPAGKTGYLYAREAGVELDGNAQVLAEYANIHSNTREHGMVFKVKKSFTVFPGNPYTDKLSFYEKIPALSDVKLTAKLVTATRGLWGSFDILLIDDSVGV
jgi:hypothetical protein